MQDTDIAQFIHQESFLNYCFKRNDEDVRYWEKWLAENPNHVLEVEAMKQMLIFMAEESHNKLKQQHLSELREKIAGSASPQIIRRITLWPRMAAAAAAIILISFGGYFLLHEKRSPNPNNIVQNDILPGKNKATLTLANGKKIVLSDKANGKFATEAGVTITKTKNGELVYTTHAATTTSQTTVQFNTLETAKGEQYQVVLPDGSHVWLNAASSLKYPVSFTGNERLVELTGEAYFEVAHNKAMPFKVRSQQQEIEVLGTHFNINAYADEGATKTTLLEGSVKVSHPDETGARFLIPGQQSIVRSVHEPINIQNINTEDVVAWKNGYFSFDHTDLQSLMRELSRWYNVDVVYESNIANDVFVGQISRSAKLSEVLKILELGDVHFKIKDNKLIVLP